jgi:hypothetical protein
MSTSLVRSILRPICLFALACRLFVPQPIAGQSQDQNHRENQKELRTQIPAGTVLPVRLNETLSVRKTKPGQRISARIMQDVPLPNEGKIAEGSRVVGTVVSVEPAAQGEGGKVSFRFDRVVTRKGDFPVGTSLRTVAGFMEVREAETPGGSPDFGTPYVWADRRQIGGDQVYGVGGPVTNQWNERVGTAVNDGVLVHVRARPESGCRGALDEEDRLQALWVFSEDACGVYGITGLQIAHAGRSEPTGEIQLTVAKGDVVVRGATAMLLRVLR